MIDPSRATDFGSLWFGAQALVHGVNPYLLIGPGRRYEWDWVLYYPATTLVAALPFTLLPELAASIAFVWVSAWALAFSITKKGWHRLFLLASAAFLIAARAAQWSPLFTAIFLQPALGWVLAAKPNIGTAIGIATPSKRMVGLAILGGLLLLAVSLWFLPDWPRYWIANVRSATHMVVPITRPGGVLVILALLRWRRPEARLIVALACFPQTGSWYESLPVLLAAETRRECQLLSILSSVGYIASARLVPEISERQFNLDVETFMIWFVYVPAVIVVLRRSNGGTAPAVWVAVKQAIRFVVAPFRVVA